MRRPRRRWPRPGPGLGTGTGPGQAAGASAPPAPDLSPAHAAQPTPAVTGPVVSPQVAAIVSAMTLPDKVGQLLVPTVPGRTVADGGAGLVGRYHVGGVIYFG